MPHTVFLFTKNQRTPAKIEAGPDALPRAFESRALEDEHRSWCGRAASKPRAWPRQSARRAGRGHTGAASSKRARNHGELHLLSGPIRAVPGHTENQGSRGEPQLDEDLAIVHF